MKKIVSRIFIYTLLLVIISGGALYYKIRSYPAIPPMRALTSAYTEHYNIAPAWPFLFRYYLYAPKNYNARSHYPLVVLLHGVSRHMRGGEYLLAEAMKSRHPAFILVPIAPKGMIWGYPDLKGGAAPMAMKAIHSVQKKFPIDEKRIYVSGYSMGGAGTFAMVEQYPNVFAAALPLCGGWDPNRAALFPNDVPILAARGSLDYPELSRNVVESLVRNRKPAQFIEYPNVGHNVWDYVYTDIKIWDWLFAQRRL